MQWTSRSVGLLRLTTTLSYFGNISRKSSTTTIGRPKSGDPAWTSSTSSSLLFAVPKAEERSWESVSARWRSRQAKSGEGNDGGDMLKPGWCAAVWTRARPCLLTIVRTDSIATTRSVATPTSQPSQWSVILSSLKPIWGTSRETPFLPGTILYQLLLTLLALPADRDRGQFRRKPTASANDVEMRGLENAVRNSSWWGGYPVAHRDLQFSPDEEGA